MHGELFLIVSMLVSAVCVCVLACGAGEFVRAGGGGGGGEAAKQTERIMRSLTVVVVVVVVVARDDRSDS